MSLRSAASAVALSIPTAAYAAAVRLRNAWYDRAGSAQRATLPVISVGNLAVGGTGKTPLVAWVVRRLQADGHVPAVVSRGYGGTAGPGPLVVSTGGGPRVDAKACGDEPHFLARSLDGAIVVVGSDRVESVRCAASTGADAVVLDDGFQHRRLARDLDIVVLDGRAPFDGGYLLPRGSLREWPGALSRAHVVVLTRLKADDVAGRAVDQIRSSGYAGPIVRAGHRVTGFHHASGKASETPARALAFCGIGDPALFRGDLEAAGVGIARFRAFRDHRPYTPEDWETLLAEGRQLGVPLVTTDKDLSRLQATIGATLLDTSLLVLRIEAVVWDEAPLLDALRRAVAFRGPAAPR